MMKEYKRDKRVFIPRDEFEEEAGDGLGQLSREEAEADLRELQSRMERRVTRRRAIWLPAAAAVVILVVASGILVTMLRQGPTFDSRLAQRGEAREEAISEGDTAYMEIAAEAVTDTVLIAMAEPVEKKEHTPGAPVATERNISAVVADEADEIVAVSEEDAEARVVANEVAVANEVTVVEEPVVQMIGAREAEAEEVVVQALPQVSMTEMGARPKKSDSDTAREAAGNKEKAKAETDAVADVKAAAAAEVKATAAAKAAVVQGDGVPESPVSPAVGWIEYQKWVTENIRYPQGITPVVRQEVLVSFTVQEDSTISDLKTVSSPGLPFTREVFRLLQEGPQWIPARQNGKVEAEVVICKFIFE